MSFLSTTTSVAGNGSWDKVYDFTNDGLFTFGIITISLTSKAGVADSDTTISVAITSSASPQPDDYIEYSTVISAGDAGLERSGIHIKPGDKVFVSSSDDNIAVRVSGILYNSSLDDIVSVTSGSELDSWKTVYTVPSSTSLGSTPGGVLNISAINRSSSTVKISLAISSSTPPAAGDYLVQNLPLNAYGDGLLHSYKVVVPGEKILVWADNASVAIRVSGLLTID